MMKENKLKKILKAVEDTKLYSAEEVTEALKESGFKVEKSKNCFGDILKISKDGKTGGISLVKKSKKDYRVFGLRLLQGLDYGGFLEEA